MFSDVRSPSDPTAYNADPRKGVLANQISPRRADVGGDFNIIRNPQEKNNNYYNATWPFIFNAIIESLNLKEIVLSGRQFTWANRRENPTYEKLDRVLASVESEQKFPLVSTRTLTRSGSDHTPLLIDSGDQAHLDNKAQLSFELSWLSEDGFYEMIKNEWEA
jgi:hypothetical protein